MHGECEQKAVSRRMEQRAYRAMHNMDEQDVRESAAASVSSALGSGGPRVVVVDDGMSHPLLDSMADKLLDCLPRLPRWLALSHGAASSGGIQMTMSPSSRGVQAPRKTLLHP